MPTAHPDGAFRTLVAVTDEELLDGDHLREAVRRASIIGFGGPHRVLASRQLDAIAPETPGHSALLDGHQALRSMKERLEPLLALPTAVDHDGVPRDPERQPTKAQERRLARPAESGPGKPAR